MLKVHCAGCNAPYEVDPKRVPKGGMKMRCPACNTTFTVTADGAKAPPPPPPAPKPASPFDDLELDLPAPKGAAPAKAVAPKADPYADLPAPKSPKPRSPKPADLELDLPAPKGAAARSDFGDIDLPAPKGAKPKPDFGDIDLPAPKSAKPKLAPAFDGVDLPAPKAAKPKLAPAFEAPTKPEAARPNPQPAPPSPPKPVSPGPPPRAAGAPRRSFSKPGAGVPNPAAPTPQSPAKPAAGSMAKDSLAIDPSPFFGDAADGTFGELDDPSGILSAPAPEIDLPAPKIAPEVDLPAPKVAKPRGGEVDLPAPKRKGPPMPGVGAGGLPAPKQPPSGSVDLPALKQPGRGPMDDLELDLPPLGDDGVDLPAVLDAGVDLPALRDAGVDLPAVRDEVDLPVARNAADLPTPKASPSGGLADRLRAAGELPADEITIPMDAKRARPIPKDSLDFDSMQEMQSELPSPFELDDASAPHERPEPAPAERRSAALGEGLKLPTMGTGAQPSGRPERKSDGLPSLLQEPDLQEPDEFDSAPMSFDLDASLGDSAKADLFGDALDSDADPLTADDDPFGLGEPPAAGAHEPLDLLGGQDPDDPLDLGTEPLEGATAGRDDYGNLDLDDGLPAGLPSAPPATAEVPLDPQPGVARRKPRELGMTLDLDEPEEAAKKKSGGGIPGWAYILLASVAFVGTGFGLGQTRYGLFGVYLIERFLPEAGDPAQVQRDIEAAEERAASDTYLDTRKSLRMLSDARMQAGLSHRLLARSLLHEGLFRLRFGPDNSSTQRSVAILSRLRERTDDAPSMHLAEAAHFAAEGQMKQAKAALAKVKPSKDPYIGLVRGEILLREGKHDKAAAQFDEALANGGGARASWGLTRAKLALGDTEAAEKAVERTLQLSPYHSAARVQKAEWAMQQDDLDTAEQMLLEATGYREVNGKRLRPSQAERAKAWTLLGQLYEKREYVSRALSAYDRALAADSLVMQAMLGSGRMLLQLSRPREALSRFQAALQAKPASTPDAEGRIPAVEAAVGAARAQLRLDENDQAIQLLGRVPEALASNPDVNLWLGHAYAQKGEPPMAEKHFRAAIEANPTQFAGYLALAQMLFAEKRPEEASKTLDAAKAQVDDGADVRRMLGQSELSRNHIKAARDQFEAALKFDPENTGALYGLAVTQRRGGELDKAQATLDRVEALDPKFPALALERGRIYEAFGKFDDAVKVYEKSLAQREGDIDLQLQLGSALVAAGDLDRAEELLRAVLRVRPTSAEAEHFVGRVVFARKDSAQAVVHFERAVNLDVTRASFHMYLAWASLESGNFAGALDSVEKAIKRDPTMGDAHWVKGRIQLRTGQVKDAIDSFKQALKLTPGRTEAYADTGDAYEELRKLRSAVAAYEAAVERDPSRGEWWYRLGSLRLDRGKQREAVQALSEAIVLGDRLDSKPAWLAEAHRIYADALEGQGRDSQAIEHYQVYLELAPKDAMDRSNVSRRIADLQR